MALLHGLSQQNACWPTGMEALELQFARRVAVVFARPCDNTAGVQPAAQAQSERLTGSI